MEQDVPISNDQEIDFCTLGMFIIGMYEAVLILSIFYTFLGKEGVYEYDNNLRSLRCLKHVEKYMKVNAIFMNWSFILLLSYI